MKKVILLFLLLNTFSAISRTDDSLIINNRYQNTEIDLHLKFKGNENKTNGFLIIASGIMFTGIGIALENKRKIDNIPDGYAGYSDSKSRALNYSILFLGIGLNITGGIITLK